MNLNELRDTAHQIARAHGWWDEERTFGDLIALCHSELSEALEDYRNGLNPDEVVYSHEQPYKPAGIPIELADLLIRVFDVAGFYGIDLDASVRLKMDYNRTRPQRHGGKVL